jgi:integrase
MAKSKPRGRRGSGSVFYDKHRDRWVALIVVTDADGTRRRVKQTAATQAGAGELLARMHAERAQTGTVSPKHYRVGDALADLARHPPASWRSPITMKVNLSHARRLDAALGSTLLGKLTPAMVAEHLRREAADGLSARTIKSELGVLRLAIRRAEQADLVGRNVAALADLPAGAAMRKSGSMTIPQARQLLAYQGLTPWWRAWLSVALLMGLRPGETGALAWEDIDFAGGALHVRHSIRETPRGLVRGPTKTDSSRRVLGMP